MFKLARKSWKRTGNAAINVAFRQLSSLEQKSIARDHNEMTKQEFTQQSEHFVKYQETIADKDQVLRPLIEAANVKSDDVILDLACGPGLISNAIASGIYNNGIKPKKIYSIDITPAFLEIGKKNSIKQNTESITNFIELECENLTSIIKENSIDTVITRWTFHHFIDIFTIINQVSKVLKPNMGRFVMLENIISENSDSEAFNLCNAIEKLRDPSHVRYYTEKEIIELLKENGFNCVNVLDRYQNTWLFKDYMDQTNNKCRCHPLQVIVETLAKHNIDTAMYTKYNKNGVLQFTDDFTLFEAIK